MILLSKFSNCIGFKIVKLVFVCLKMFVDNLSFASLSAALAFLGTSQSRSGHGIEASSTAPALPGEEP